MSALAAYSEAYAALPQAPQPWLRALKQAALQRAEARGLPTLRDEAWKYSSIGALEKRGFRPVVGHAKLSTADLEALTIISLEGYRAVFVNGRFDAEEAGIGNWTGRQAVMRVGVVRRCGHNLAGGVLQDGPPMAGGANRKLNGWIGIEIPPGAQAVSVHAGDDGAFALDPRLTLAAV